MVAVLAPVPAALAVVTTTVIRSEETMMAVPPRAASRLRVLFRRNLDFVWFDIAR